jgi:hypothetical protein
MWFVIRQVIELLYMFDAFNLFLTYPAICINNETTFNLLKY